MKKTFLTAIAVLASLYANCQQLIASFDYSSYMLVDKRSYIETYLVIDGKTVNYTVNDVNLESKIDVTMVFKNADDLVEFRHFVVGNPPLPDTTDVFPDFTDVQRIFIPQGIYNFELRIKDLNAPDSLKKTIERHEIIAVDIPQKQIALSGIELLESFNPTLERTINLKNGFECIPYGKCILPAEIEFLRFYVEFYNVANELDGLGKCNVYTCIKDAYTQKTMANHSSTTTINALNYYQFLKEIDIKKLPAGKYFLTVEIRDQYNKLCGTASKYFERENIGIVPTPYSSENKTLRSSSMYTSIDTLNTILDNMKFIADSTECVEIDKVKASADLITIHELLYNFWAQRNQFNPDDALADFTRLGNSAQKAQCGDSQKLIMLRYGIPNTIVDKSDSAQPFEVWHYYKIGNLTNIKFIFKNKELFHSNMPCEKQNENWMNDLFGNSTPATDDSEIFEGL